MFKIRTTRLRIAAGFTAAALVGACTDSGVTTPTNASALRSVPRFAIIPTPAQVVVPGADGGAFVNVIDANNSGRAYTEFWDNYSFDNINGIVSCNAGFFATGTLLPGCDNETAGSRANQGGFAKYWGDNVGNRDASSFMFSGAYTYNVKLVGSYAGLNSVLGWFTRNLGVYQFHLIPDWGNKVLNTQVTIDPAGQDWGFFIRNNFNPDLLGCDISVAGFGCSDATGGFSNQLFQQFALFVNSAGTQYMVGAEDNQLYTGGSKDSDYNDYIFTVSPIAYEPPPVPSQSLGCSPGYWKNHKFPAGYSKTQLFSATSFGGSTFENAFPGMTLQQVLSQGGGGLAALGRQTVSAFFNGVTLAGFEKSPKVVIDEFNSAFPGSKGAYTLLQDAFESLIDVNGRKCPNPTGK